jgi:anti-anti-sigma factor
MALRMQTDISGDVFILQCEGRIVFGDEGAALRERVGNMLIGTPRIVVNLEKVDHIDSGGLGILVGLFISARNRGGELKLICRRQSATIPESPS